MRLGGIWLQYVRCHEVPGPGRWLAEAEWAELAKWRATERRLEFLAGRLAAKRLARRLLGQQDLDLAAIEIRSQDACGQTGPPVWQVTGRPLPWRLSIAHTARGALAGASLWPSALGVDLVPLDIDCRSLARTWFTAAELAWLAEHPGDGAPAVWAAKEAAYKAVGGQEPFRPLRIHISALRPGRFAARYDRPHDGPNRWPAVQIRIRVLDGHVAAVAWATPLATPQGGNHD